MGIINNIKKFGFKDIFSKQKQRQFTTAKKEEFTGIKLKADEVDSFVEQYIYRGLLCPECKEVGNCLVCECPFKDIQRTRVANCGMKDEEGNDNPRWTDMQSPEDWEKTKELLGIRLYHKIVDRK